MKSLLCTVVSLSLLSPVALASESGKLSIWISAGPNYQGLQTLLTRFTKETGIAVQLETPDSPTQRFEEAMKSGQGPDIIFWAHDPSGDWSEKGFIQAVSPSEAIKSQSVQLGWDAFTYKGKIWGYPIGAEAIGMIYNRQLIAKPPASFEELIPLAATYTAKGQRVIGWETNSPYFSWPMLAAHGGYIYKRASNGEYDANDVGVGNAGALKGASVFSQLLSAGVIPKGGISYGDAEKAMLEGRQALWITGPWAWVALKKAGIDFGVAPLPTVQDKPARPFVGVFGAMIAANAANRDAAVKFLEGYLLTMDGLAALNGDKSIGVPVNKRFFWKQVQNENIRNMMDGVAFGRPMPSTPLMGQFWQHMGTAFGELANGKTPAEALTTAATAMKPTPPAEAPK